MFMKLPILSLLVLAVLAFSACDPGETLKDADKAGLKEEGKEGCFALAYPVTYLLPGGSTATGNDEKELWAAIKAWYEAHPDSKEKPILQYPVDIVLKDGTTKTIADEEAMMLAKKACGGGKGELKVCDWDGSKVADPAVWEEHIVEPLVTNEECGGCIVGGVVKYVKTNTDFAYVIYYGKGECDEWAYLVTYYGASDKKGEKCNFKLDCDSGEN
jgi:hypothetical protein